MQNLPIEVTDLLEKYQAPVILKRHLTLVYNTSIEICSQFAKEWANLSFDKQEILFGAATHDIGKVIETNELSQKGNNHEQAGYELLLKHGLPEKLARFAKTHGNWEDESLEMEDLMVALADKIWKGKRVEALEEKLTKEISIRTNTDYWEVYTKLDAIISKIALGADERLLWQNK